LSNPVPNAEPLMFSFEGDDVFGKKLSIQVEESKES